MDEKFFICIFLLKTFREFFSMFVTVLWSLEYSSQKFKLFILTLICSFKNDFCLAQKFIFC